MELLLLMELLTKNILDLVPALALWAPIFWRLGARIFSNFSEPVHEINIFSNIIILLIIEITKKVQSDFPPTSCFDWLNWDPDKAYTEMCFHCTCHFTS